jgi:arylsulfatase A-like enzyme
MKTKIILRQSLGPLLLAWIALPGTCFSQQNQSASKSRPNIVFILIDDLRWDELGIAGHPYMRTPNIDRIGREGAVVRNIHYLELKGMDELYDLKTDTFEMTNLIDQLSARKALARMKHELHRVLKNTGAKQ